jgi:hypothetical protein
MSEPLIIKDFDQAIGDSAHKGFGLMRCVDIEEFPGAVKANKATVSIFDAAYSSTFTADAGTDVCTSSATVPATGVAVVLTTTGTLPAGLSAATTYFIIKLSGTTFKLATTLANANASTAIDITDAGTGTHTVTTRNPGTINHIVKDPRIGTKFMLDSNGRVWFYLNGTTRLLNGNTLTNGVGNGLAILWNSNDSAMYLFVFRNALIDVVNVHGTAQLEAPSWTSGWQTMNSGAGSGNRHHAVYAQDAIIYYTDGKYIGSIREKAGQVFDPANAATYTWTSQALDTPQGEVLVHIEEHGSNLLAAGSSYNKVYPWDRISDSYNLPLIVPENNVQRLKNIGGLVYILAGSWGNIYVTQGTYVRHFKKLPNQVINNSGTLQANPITWGGIDAVNGNLIFGVQALTTGNSGAYMLYPDGKLVIDQIPSTGSSNVTAFEVSNNFYLMGYSGGVDTMDTSRYASFNGVVQSGFYRVATKTEKATYSTLECVIAKPATSGHIRVGYRTDTSSSFTTLDTYTADSTNTTFETDIGLIDIENIQVQAEIDGTMELVELRFLP